MINVSVKPSFLLDVQAALTRFIEVAGRVPTAIYFGRAEAELFLIWHDDYSRGMPPPRFDGSAELSGMRVYEVCSASHLSFGWAA